MYSIITVRRKPHMVKRALAGPVDAVQIRRSDFFDPDGRFLKKTGSPVRGRKNGVFYAVFKAFFADFFLINFYRYNFIYVFCLFFA